ncbi:MAG: DnaJ domain-containing protein [Saprospiraceae bacterium]
MKNYYKILGVQESASLAEIKGTYRKLAFMFHPDKNKDENAPEKFRHITEAYEILRDPSKRQEFDRILSVQRRQNEFKPAHSEFNEKFNQWEQFGRQKSNQYSSMEYDDFISKVIDEVKIGASYIPNLFTIGLVCMMIFGILSALPDAFEGDGGIGIFFLFMLVGLCVLVYHLFQRMSSDYNEERRRKIK